MAMPYRTGCVRGGRGGGGAAGGCPCAELNEGEATAAPWPFEKCLNCGDLAEPQLLLEGGHSLPARVGRAWSGLGRAACPWPEQPPSRQR